MQPNKAGLKVCSRGNTLQFAAGKGLSVFQRGLVGFPQNFTVAARNDPVSVGKATGKEGDGSCMCLVFKGSVISATWLGFPAHVVYLK